jgi:exodeoxyribonuclease V alpha subunit
MEDNTRLIFVGDVDQLPPISPGQVFKDLIDSKKISTVRLLDNFRQKDGKQIVVNANKIIKGIMPNLEDDLAQFEFIEENNEHKALELVLEKYLSLYKGTNEFCTHTQILIPMKKGTLGSFNINKTIQRSMNRKTELIKKNDDVMIYQGDTVIQTRNNYQLGVINGDIGQVIDQEIEGKKKSIIVNINGSMHIYEGKDIFDIDPAYALTIHRSQGSEYDNVIIPVSNQHEFMLDPKLLYTAVTRAKKKVLMIGNKQSFINGLKANWKYDRLTFLDKVIEDTF